MELKRLRNHCVRWALAPIQETLDIQALALSRAVVSDPRGRHILGHRQVEMSAGWVPPVSETRLDQPPDRPVRSPDSPADAPAGRAGSQEVVRLCASEVDHVVATEVATPPKRLRRDPAQRHLAIRSRADRGICDLRNTISSRFLSVEDALTEASCF